MKTVLSIVAVAVVLLVLGYIAGIVLALYMGQRFMPAEET